MQIIFTQQRPGCFSYWIALHMKQGNIRSSPRLCPWPSIVSLYMDDIKDKIKSNTRLYADDTIMYREINSIDNHNILQYDLDTLSEWSTTGLMDFNICKCAILPITRSVMQLSSIIPSLVILFNVLMTMSILVFQPHTIFILKSIAIRSQKRQIKLFGFYVVFSMFIYVPLSMLQRSEK